MQPRKHKKELTLFSRIFYIEKSMLTFELAGASRLGLTSSLCSLPQAETPLITTCRQNAPPAAGYHCPPRRSPGAAVRLHDRQPMVRGQWTHGGPLAELYHDWGQHARLCLVISKRLSVSRFFVQTWKPLFWGDTGSKVVAGAGWNVTGGHELRQKERGSRFPG
ncbi:hypothetical protein MDA_GLEAN10011957 [Myotis davidii]|uniref:Uncharacterized protein n=1 Tax=Myotis davidii TaxID=225400 RepID=L5LZY0_MYODS|nr:hypothetical protein MDA_GLEAN10011957 [Myotis davidii]